MLELKFDYSRTSPYGPWALNRTMLELKSARLWSFLFRELPLNRTMLELKSLAFLRRDALHQLLIVPCWNWNGDSWVPALFSHNLLIVPCWNWNVLVATCPVRADHLLIVPCWNWNHYSYWDECRENTLNRTMLELKFLWNEQEDEGNCTLNRTMLELKFKSFSLVAAFFLLLIVPCWNWNWRNT